MSSFFPFREDSMRVYVKIGIFPGGNTYAYNFQGNGEYLMYDYSLDVGDTVPSKYYTEQYLNNNTPFIIDSIDSISIGGEFRKRFYISNNEGCINETIVEGIGSSKGLFYPTNGLCPQYQFALLCYEFDTILYKPEQIQANFGSSCYINNVGIGEITPEVVHIYPNPAQDYISIGLPVTYNKANLQIINMLGQLVKTVAKNNGGQQRIETTNLPNGIYQLFVSSSNRLLGKEKLVIAK